MLNMYEQIHAKDFNVLFLTYMLYDLYKKRLAIKVLEGTLTKRYKILKKLKTISIKFSHLISVNYFTKTTAIA